MTSLREPARWQRRRHGASGFLFLFLIGVPMLFLSSAIATDLALLTLGQSQASIVAESSSIAGAFQQQSGRAELDRASARRVAEEVVQDALAAGAAPTTSHLRVVGRPTVTDREVTVTLEYQIPYTQFGRWFGATGGTSYRVTRSAEVCVPGTPGSTNGFCARPRG